MLRTRVYPQSAYQEQLTSISLSAGSDFTPNELILPQKINRVTSFDRQVVEHGDCVAYSVAGATVHAPVFASRYARLLRRDRPRLKARAVATAKLLREGVVSADTKPPATLRRKPRNMSLVYRNSYIYKLLFFSRKCCRGSLKNDRVCHLLLSEVSRTRCGHYWPHTRGESSHHHPPC